MPRTPTMQATPPWKVRTAYALSGVVALFLLSDAIMKLMQIPIVLETTAQLGWPVGSVVPLGIVLLLATGLYVFPRTSMLGAILLTGYLGGAEHAPAPAKSPVQSHLVRCLPGHRGLGGVVSARSAPAGIAAACHPPPLSPGRPLRGKAPWQLPVGHHVCATMTPKAAPAAQGRKGAMNFGPRITAES